MICYWLSRALIFENYATGKKVAGDPLIAAILHFCGQCRSMDELLKKFPDQNPVDLRGGIRRLLNNSLLERRRKENNKGRGRWENWVPWAPSASFFHFSTKNANYVFGLAENLSGLKKLADEDPLPELTKKYPHKSALQLKCHPVELEFPRVLVQRRTWREFSGKSLAREGLEQLLWLSLGVQGWVDVPGVGSLALTTSPSGGALDPIEAYVCVRNVKGVGAGIYHYDSANHRLELLRKGLRKQEIARFLAGQEYFSGAAFVIFLAAVFARTQWKYEHPRAYRAVLAEVGHVCQTFCLTATWLGLAPFCTMALADTKIENALKIDGVGESVLYAMGAGERPPRGATAERLRRRE
ncbi:MAG TPA: SagB/ThcOx family dehydrogenase [Candidatus Acidoferrum sp.]|nr:SagB/ThcOx family dehydrogenase [Candidatus Acidoferrum sp.]